MAIFVNLSSLIGHEETKLKQFEKLKNEIQRDGILKKPIAVDKNTNIILDGHHRFNAIRSMGLTKIPVIFVDYNSPDVVMRPWRKSDENLTKEMMIEKVLKGEKFPPKTTKNFVKVNGKLKHISEIEKPVNVPLEELS